VEVKGAAVAADEDVVVGCLAVAGLAAGLNDGFGEGGEAPHVVAGELSASGVGGQLAAGCELAVGDEWSTIALGAEAVVLEGDQDGVRVTVIELQLIDVVAVDAGLPEGGLCGFGGAGVDPGVAAGVLVVAGWRHARGR
jgi:hypothetical protein